MSIIYDADGFAHRAAISNYDRNGYLQPAFDFSKGHVTEDFIKLLKERFFSEDAALVSTLSEEGERYSMRPAWDEFTDPPNEVYIMIGNGFDIECGLPTSYSDFLRFLEAIEKKGHGTKLHSDVQSHLADMFSINPNYDSEWNSVINNYWYEYFRTAKIKLGWVDFENEIAKVIHALENSMDLVRYHRGSMDDYVGCYSSSELHQVIGGLLTDIESEDTLPDGSKYTTYKLLYRDLRDILLNDLNALIRGFETYLREYVETIDVVPTANIRFLMERLEEVDQRFVLTFNYTTTFERVLKKEGIDAEFCYIHGKIGDGKSKNKMVLGIDEHLEAEGIKNLIGYAPFRKYNQRIFKATDSNYMDWLDEIEDSKTLDRMLYIFGHSIGITDKDIIGQFIKASDMRSVLFYHNDDAFSNQVSNLTAIIGLDEMIRRTGGKTHTMEFRKQHTGR